MTCENCGTTKPRSSILRHIAHVKECLDFYGPRFQEMKSEKNRHKVKIFRQKHGNEEELKKQRETYARNPQKKNRQSKECYQNHQLSISKASRDREQAKRKIMGIYKKND